MMACGTASSTALTRRTPPGDRVIEIAATRPAPGTDVILTPEALAFLADLQAGFGPRREALLAARRDRQAAIDAGADLDFDPATAEVRASDWTVPPAPAALTDR